MRHVGRSIDESATERIVPRTPSGTVRSLVAVARPDHWFKNVFMLLGVLLALFYYPFAMTTFSWSRLLMALASTCLVASSNYVINEILDAPRDRMHPTKRVRPIAAGQLNATIAYMEWSLLGISGMAAAWYVSGPFFLSAAALLMMGLIYNVPPLRSKEVPYVDVLSESVNNPIRLVMGWFVVSATTVPPMSLIIAYWMVGAFFMASKRFAEYRAISDKETAVAYRRTFAFYDENRLLVSMFTYACGGALFLGVFIIRYHLELILAVPLIAGFFGYYLQIALKTESAAQNPERLYHERGLVGYLVLCLIAFVALMFVEIPLLYDIFNVTPSQLPPLWRL